VFGTVSETTHIVASAENCINERKHRKPLGWWWLYRTALGFGGDGKCKLVLSKARDRLG
jgi:hypothetical protein